jgi:hypothetical protein
MVPYATVPVEKRCENWPLQSRGFRLWLQRLYYTDTEKAPSAQSLQDALGILQGKALFDGPEHRAYLRVAMHQGKIHLDLGDKNWRAVEIDSDGWKVIDEPPVMFRRARAMLPLPVPVKGGSLSELRRFVNVTDEDWPLLLGWLLAALYPAGPFPVLCLHGEQGSAKSTTARALRSLVDPNTAPVRAEPREVRDLAIAANNGAVIALDNVSYLSPWLSDALCRLSTGGGFSTRTLYENDEETIFDGQRPVILNGIEEVVTRSDLLDRSLLVCLPTIPEANRKTESAFWKEFDQARPGILGALLDVVVAGLRNLPGVKIDTLPRMADFATWVVACEPALGWKPETFLKAYRGNRTTANRTALETSPVVKYLLQLVEKKTFEGTAGELLRTLETTATEGDKRLQSWPKTPRAIRGVLQRFAPNLRATGVSVLFTDQWTRHGKILRVDRSGEQPLPPLQPLQTSENPGIPSADEQRLQRSGNGGPSGPLHENNGKTQPRNGCNGRNGHTPPFADEPVDPEDSEVF